MTSDRCRLWTCLALLGISLSVPAWAAPPAATTRSVQPATAVVDQVLEPIMIAEFAVNNGDLKQAAKQYLLAAQRSGDASVAQNAFRLALLTQDDDAARKAVAIWEQNPIEPQELLGARAAIALREQRNSDAVKSLAAMLNSDDERIHKLALATLATATRTETQAKQVLKQLIHSDSVPNRLSAWVAVGGVAQALDDNALTQEAIAQMVKRFPSEPRVAVLRAVQERLAGHDEAAAAILKPLEPLAATDETLRSSIALEYRLLGRFNESARVMAMGEQDVESYADRAASLALAQDNAALIALYNELQQRASKPDPALRLLLGQMAEHLKKWDEALRWYASVPGDDLRWRAQLESVNVLYELKRTAELQALLKTLQSDSQVPDDVRRDAFLLESTIHQRMGDSKAETEALDRALAAFPDDPNVLYTRALSFERRDQVDQALAEFRKILVIDPNNVDALNALGYTLADRTTQYREALQLINRARAAQPNNPSIIDSYGWVLYRMGNLDEALKQLRRAANLQKDPEILAHLAEVLLKTGDREGAQKAFEQAVKLDTENDNRAVKKVRDLLGAKP